MNPLFDLPSTGKQDIPEKEDLPLILAWIKPCTDLLQKCERRGCKHMAAFIIDEYEDKNVIIGDMQRGVPIKVLEERIWQHTMREQMQNRFTIYNTAYECLDHLLPVLMAFLNTTKDQDLRVLLMKMKTKPFTLVQYHFLSYPDMGLCTITPIDIHTPQEFLAWMKIGTRTTWQIQE